MGLSPPCGPALHLRGVPDQRALRGRPRTRRRCCSSSATTSGTAQDRACAGPTRSTRRSGISLRVRNFETAQAQGQRQGRQPDRDRRRRGLAGGRHRRGAVRGRQLQELRPRAERGRRCATWPRSYPYDAHDDEVDVAARQHRRGRRAAEAGDAGAAGEGRRARCSRRASATSPTRPRSPPAMLQRQQAGAIIAARAKIVEGAVGHGGDGAGDAVAEGRRAARRGAQGRDGAATCWWCSAASARTQPVVNTGHHPLSRRRGVAGTEVLPAARRPAAVSRPCSAGRTTTCAA